MPQSKAELEELLALAATKTEEANTRVTELVDENEKLRAALEEANANHEEASGQVETLNQTVADLESALAHSSAREGKVLAVLKALREQMDKVQDQTKRALDAARNSASNLELTGRLSKIASAVDDDLQKKIAEYNKKVAAGEHMGKG